ncbi:oxygenase MpaB family protein [Algoriphagus sp.]|uniref:oxygenase MpaB family protein n=1 Tax=Algoriphagus sp. TaxID=1872435 RepID=UPI0025F7D19A|nr:oxygenase MpaB family protein [Algoriphagus sp.]
MRKLKLYTNDQLNDLRKQMDPSADQAVLDLIKNPEIISQINHWENIPSEIPIDFPESVKTLLKDYNMIPSIQDQGILKRGQGFFNERGDIYLAMLGFYSLPYCYAFADGAEVLVRSKRIMEESGKRLGETAKFLLEIFKPGAFITSNNAFLVCAKIRLIHAFSRYFIEHYAKDWKEEYGKPINQEDLLGTNLAFSLLVLRGMRKIGFNISKDDTEVVLAYWKYVGKLMGIQEGFWPDTSKEAFELEKLIRKRHMKNSLAGERLIRSLLNYYEENQREEFLKGKSESLVAFMIGKEASKALGIKSELPLTSEIMGTIFKFLGWKNYAGNKSHSRFSYEFEQSYFQQFGTTAKINLPERKRS